MRFSVSYRLNKLDLTYRMKVYSLIKQSVRMANSSYYDKIFVQSENKIKPFSFSTFLHNFSLSDSMINLNQITITISSPDMEFAVHCFNGLRQIKRFQDGDECWIQSNVQLLNENIITKRKAVFKTLSSMLIEDKDGKPLSPTDAGYELELNYYANLQVKEFVKRDLYEKIKFTPIRMKKVVVRERNRHIRPNNILFFTTYQGLFCLEGNPQDLQLLYQLGVGKRTTYFGLLDYQGDEV